MIQSNFTRRRIRNLSLLVIGCGLVVGLLKVVETALLNVNEWSGWILFAACSLLYLYAMRKRLSMLPLGKVSNWLQFHLYLGVFGTLVFFIHSNWSLPTGVLEILLASCFFGTAVTGLLGIYWSRTLPSTITRLGDEVLFERIAGFLIKVRNDAESVVVESVKQTESTALADYYQRRASQYFERSRFQIPRLYRAHEPWKKLERELDDLSRYMQEDEIEFTAKMKALIRQKDMLDAHFTLQGILKYWLMVHLLFAVSMLPLLFVHIVLVYNFGEL